MPVTPVCQLGLGHPLLTTVSEPCAAPVLGLLVVPVLVAPVEQAPRVVLVLVVLLTTQLLAPPPPPTVSTRKSSVPSPCSLRASALTGAGVVRGAPIGSRGAFGGGERAPVEVGSADHRVKGGRSDAADREAEF